VEYGIPGTIGENSVQRGGIGKVADHELGPGGHRGTMTGAQIVQHHDRIATLDQRGDDVAADVPGTSGDKKPL
jgi:hypothetical protein